MLPETTAKVTTESGCLVHRLLLERWYTSGLIAMHTHSTTPTPPADRGQVTIAEDGWRGRWTDRWVDEWMDGWTKGWTTTFVSKPFSSQMPCRSPHLVIHLVHSVQKDEGSTLVMLEKLTMGPGARNTSVKR